MKTNIAVFFGCRSVEHEVSIISAVQAMRAINREKYDVTPVYVTKNGEMYTGGCLFEIENYRNLPELLKNAEPVTLKNENGVIMHLSDYLIYIEDDDTLREPYNIKSDINITYKDGTTDILKQSAYVNDTLVLNDFPSSVGKHETKKYGIATVQYILKLIDSKNVKSVSFDGQTFTAVEQS